MEATDEQITRLSDLALEVSRIKSVPMVLVVSELINTGTLRAMRCSHKGIFTKEQAEAGISILERWKRQALEATCG